MYHAVVHHDIQHFYCIAGNSGKVFNLAIGKLGDNYEI